MDKSHEHLYKSKAKTIIYLFNNYLHIPLLFAAPSQPNTKFTLSSHTHWRCLCWEDMLIEPLLEESAA